MIQKHEIPILEYDSDSAEVIRPDHGAEQLVLPEKCVFGFLGDVIDDYAREMNAVIAEHFETITKSYPIYIVRQNELEFCLCPETRCSLWPDSLHCRFPCKCLRS